MDLSRASVEEIAQELRQRGLDFTLLCRPPAAEDEEPEESDYAIYSSEQDSGQPSFDQAVRCLLGALSVLMNLYEGFDQHEQEERAQAVWRWVAVGEVLLNDIFRATDEWFDGEEKPE